MDGKKKNNFSIFICLVLLIPMSTVGAFLTYIFYGLIGNLVIGYVISFLIVGAVASFPILREIDTEKKMQGWKRFLIRGGIVVLFSALAFGVLVLSTAFNRVYKERWLN